MAGLIHHLPNKVDLLAAVLAARDADDHTRLHSMLGNEPTGLQVLDAFVATARMNADRYSFVQLSHLIAAESARGAHPGTEFTRQHFRSTRDLVQKAMRRSIDSGEIKRAHAPGPGRAGSFAMIEGLENQWLHDPDGIDLSGVFRGVGVRPERRAPHQPVGRFCDPVHIIGSVENPI